MLAKFSEKAGDIKDETLRKTVMETVQSAARALENIRSSAKAQELLADNSTVWAPRVRARACARWKRILRKRFTPLR